MIYRQLVFLITLIATLTGCSYNPLVQTNRTTGSAIPTAVGAGAGVGFVSLFGGSKTMMGVAGLGGGLLGYYSSTLRYASGGVMRMGGDVYSIGDFVGIYIPTDKIFYSNTAEFTPNAKPVLDSVIAVLERYPDNNIMISGNTSGFDRRGRELALSTKRAKMISAYLWSQGINDFEKTDENKIRKLNYVGYGDFFPVASTRSASGIRENSRIQITSYPSSESLSMDGKEVLYNNIAALTDRTTIEDKNKHEDLWRRCDQNLEGRGCYTGTEALTNES